METKQTCVLSSGENTPEFKVRSSWVGLGCLFSTLWLLTEGLLGFRKTNAAKLALYKRNFILESRNPERHLAGWFGPGGFHGSRLVPLSSPIWVPVLHVGPVILQCSVPARSSREGTCLGEREDENQTVPFLNSPIRFRAVPARSAAVRGWTRQKALECPPECRGEAPQIRSTSASLSAQLVINK